MITLQEAKDYLQVTTTANDAMLQVFIDAVTDEIETYCGRTFTTATYTDEVLHYVREFFDQQYNPALDVRNGRLKVYLKNTPVQSCQLKANGTILTEASDYLLDDSTGEITLMAYYDDDDNKLLATYVAGYASVPASVKMVALEGVKQSYQNWGVVTAGGKEVESKSVGDFSVKYSKTYDSGTKSYIAANLKTLDKYSKWEL